MSLQIQPSRWCEWLLEEWSSWFWSTRPLFVTQCLGFHKDGKSLALMMEMDAGMVVTEWNFDIWEWILSNHVSFLASLCEEHGLFLVEYYVWSQLKPRPNGRLNKGIACTWYNVQPMVPFTHKRGLNWTPCKMSLILWMYSRCNCLQYNLYYI